MNIGEVPVAGRVAWFVEFLNALDGKPFGEREVASDRAPDLLAVPLRHPAVAFRFFKRIVAVAAVDGMEEPLLGRQAEVGSWHYVGQLVSREYMLALLPEPPMNIGSLDRLIADFETPGTRMARLTGGGFRVLGPTDVVVDANGNAVEDVLGPPEGWRPQTQFVGGVFYVDLLPSFLSVRSFDGGVEGCAVVHFSQGIEATPALDGDAMVARVVNSSEGVQLLHLRPGADIVLPAGPSELRLAWDGETLTAEVRNRDGGEFIPAPGANDAVLAASGQ